MNEELIEVAYYVPDTGSFAPIIKEYSYEEFKQMYPEYKAPKTNN